MNEYNKSYWFVGASYDGGSEDKTEYFLKEGIWVNGYNDKLFDEVNRIKKGDQIAIKSSYTKKYNLPFEANGKTVSVMGIKAIGVVTENLGDGRNLKVKWQPFGEKREWYFFTHRSTIWEVKSGRPYEDALIAFTFENKPQNYELFRNGPFWQERYGDLEAFDVYPEILKFIEQAKTENLKTKDFLHEAYGLNVKVSFGMGMAAKIPWISFLGKGQQTSKGIYPVYLLIKEFNCLILCYGVSEENVPDKQWYGVDTPTYAEYLLEHYNYTTPRYGNSRVFKAYDLSKPLDKVTLNKDLSEIVRLYKSVLEDFHENTDSTSKPVYVKYRLPKPFILLAGISGTGKTRFVREQANIDKTNYQIIPVRPDWHEPSDLLGYISRIGNHGPEYVITDVLKFMVKAWCAAYGSADENKVTLKDISTIEPYWLCLDEMNLAPVEQYFADYLSVLETRKWNGGEYSCDALLKLDAMSDVLKPEGMAKLRKHLGIEQDVYDGLWSFFCKQGIPLPPNLIVAGTVNMDETTHGFSRKVLDRAFTIDFGAFFPNEFKYYLETEAAPKPITFSFPVLSQVGKNELANVPADTDGAKSIAFLDAVNAVLRGSPFELAYRAVNELMLAVVCFSPEDDDELKAVWDDFMMTKVLPRIEGDADKLRGKAGGDKSLLEELDVVLQVSLADKRPDLFRKQTGTEDKLPIDTRSRKKLQWMQARLANGFTSFWP